MYHLYDLIVPVLPPSLTVWVHPALAAGQTMEVSDQAGTMRWFCTFIDCRSAAQHIAPNLSLASGIRGYVDEHIYCVYALLQT